MAKFIGQPKPSKAIARCTNYKHSGLLSVNNMKKHKCLEKQCRYFIPLTDHPYWKQREKKISDKKYRKRIRQINDTIKYGTDEQIGCLIEKIILKEW